MPRRPRYVVPGVPHHVTQRGNNRQCVFFGDEDRIRYLTRLGEALQRYQVRILGWCLMTNHVHLIAIPEARSSLALAVGQAHSQYSMELNKHRDSSGHVWQGRYYSSPIESSHLLSAMRYVDLNPVRAKMTDCALDWTWSSARAHGMLPGCDRLLDWEWTEWIAEARLGGWSYRDWRDGLLGVEGMDEEWVAIRRATRVGEPLGSEAFIRELEAKAGRRLKVMSKGRPRRTEKVAAMAVGQQEVLFKK